MYRWVKDVGNVINGIVKAPVTVLNDYALVTEVERLRNIRDAPPYQWVPWQVLQRHNVEGPYGIRSYILDPWAHIGHGIGFGATKRYYDREIRAVEEQYSWNRGV